ncbi:MAG: response regulator transcription factor [Firmicutes bacterium]|nr:response regulator transcription factor [Bacillota bacterium]
MHSEVEILNLLAIAAAGMGDEAYSMHYIEKALEIGSKEGYVRSFADELAPMYDLLKTYVTYRGNKSVPAAYAEKLLGCAVKSIKVIKTVESGISPYLISHLTPWENQVLHLLADGLSNSEIAKELNIALSTVKYHNVNLFGKLGAKTRLEAINKARKLACLIEVIEVINKTKRTDFRLIGRRASIPYYSFPFSIIFSSVFYKNLYAI